MDLQHKTKTVCCVVAFCTVGVNAQRARWQMGFIIICGAQTFGGPGFLHTLGCRCTLAHASIHTNVKKKIRCVVLNPGKN